MGERVGAVAAIVPATGRYAVQGTQMRLGIELWAERVGRQLVVADDESRPERAAELHEELLGGDYRFVLGPYGSDSTRAVAATRPGVLWNHGAAADDVQRLPGVVSLPSPASRYLVALGRAIAELHPGCRIALVTAAGPFARFAREGIERAASSLELEIVGTFSLGDDPEAIAGGSPDAVLACGSIGQELRLFRRISIGHDIGLLAGVSPALIAFPELLERSVEGFLAPVQWHPDVGDSPSIGPNSRELLEHAGRALDYVAAQAYAAALIAERCLELDAADPYAAARVLRTRTFFGAFELDPASGLQVGHRLSVVRWHGGRQELLLPNAA